MSLHQFENLRGRVVVALKMWPARPQNIKALSFDCGVYMDLHDALSAHDGQQSRSGFLRLRNPHGLPLGRARRVRQREREFDRIAAFTGVPMAGDEEARARP